MTEPKKAKDFKQQNTIFVGGVKNLLEKEVMHYWLWGGAYFVLTFFLVGFAIVFFVQGISIQLSGKTELAFILYFMGPILIFLSYSSFMKAKEKMHILEMTPS